MYQIDCMVSGEVHLVKPDQPMVLDAVAEAVVSEVGAGSRTSWGSPLGTRQVIDTGLDFVHRVWSTSVSIWGICTSGRTNRIRELW